MITKGYVFKWLLLERSDWDWFVTLLWGQLLYTKFLISCVLYAWCIGYTIQFQTPSHIVIVWFAGNCCLKMKWSCIDEEYKYVDISSTAHITSCGYVDFLFADWIPSSAISDIRCAQSRKQGHLEGRNSWWRKILFVEWKPWWQEKYDK